MVARAGKLTSSNLQLISKGYSLEERAKLGRIWERLLRPCDFLYEAIHCCCRGLERPPCLVSFMIQVASGSLALSYSKLHSPASWGRWLSGTQLRLGDLPPQLQVCPKLVKHEWGRTAMQNFPYRSYSASIDETRPEILSNMLHCI
jgi:hypothetical protein